MGQPVTEIGVQLPLVADRPLGIRRAREVVFDHRPAFRLVRIEQVGAGPAAQHPGEFPPEVEAVVDRGVHPGAATRCHAVRGVADQEGAVGAEPLGELRGEREAPDPLDARFEVVDAGAEADQPRQPRFGEVRELLRVRSHVTP